MKNGYKRLLILELFIFVILVINLLLTRFSSNLFITVILLTSLIIFKRLFGFEKDRHRYIKDLFLDTFIFLATFLILYYLSGIFFGFTYSMNMYTPIKKLGVIFILIVNVFLKEYFRYMMLCKSELNKLSTVATIFLFILLDMSILLPYAVFTDNYSIFKFIALTLFPTISTNISFSYVSRKGGYKPVIFYSLIMTLYPYIIPIVPNVNNYFYSLIFLLIPLLYSFRIYRFFLKSRDEEKNSRENNKLIYKFISLVPVSLFVMFVICIYSGYFRFWVVAIASGSMEPKISIGDLVIIDQNVNKQELQEGQIIAYRRENMIVVSVMKISLCLI